MAKRSKFSWSEIVLTAGIGFVLSYGLTFVFFVRFSIALFFCLAFSIALLLGLIFRFWKAALITFGCMGLIALILMLLPARKDIFAAASLFGREYAHWINNYKPDPGFDFISSALIILGVTLPVFMLVHYRAPLPILLAIGGGLYFTLDTLGYVYPFWLFWTFLALVLLLFSYQTPQTLQRHSMLLLCALPFCLIIILTARLIPARDEPMGKPIIDWVNSEVSLFEGTGTGTGNALFTEKSKRLGGSFKPKGDTMLRLYPGSNSSAPYLRGKVYALYNGQRWFENPDEPMLTPSERFRSGAMFGYSNALEYYPYEIVNPYQAVYTAILTGFNIELPVGFGQVERSRLLYENINTNIVFTPENTYGIGLNPSDVIVSPGEVFLSNARLKQDGEYMADYFIMPQIREVLEDYLNITKQGYSRKLLASLENRLADSDLLSLLELYPEISDYVYKNYLQIPETVPQRVYDLSGEICVYDSDYKNATAIERYLARNYRYNLEMKPTPANEDFVDYFLFEQGEGYCTYFATAMVILCRASGLPARYIEGFAPSNKNGADGEFIYTDEMAHAWCEVYLDGAGWVRFEPTSPYYTSSNSIIDDQTEPEPTPEPLETPKPEQTPTPTPTVTPTPVSEAEQPVKNDTKALRIALTVIIPVLMIILVRLTLWFAYKRERSVLKNFPYTRQGADMAFKRIVWLLQRVGITQEKQETVNEFAIRAGEGLNAGETLVNAARIYTKSLFNRGELDSGESGELYICIETLECEVYGKMNTVSRFIWRTILNRV